MEGGIAIFLLLLIVLAVVGAVTGAPAAIAAAFKARSADSGGGRRPEHKAVEDESASTQDVPGRLPPRD